MNFNVYVNSGHLMMADMRPNLSSERRVPDRLVMSAVGTGGGIAPYIVTGSLSYSFQGFY